MHLKHNHLLGGPPPPFPLSPYTLTDKLAPVVSQMTALELLTIRPAEVPLPADTPAAQVEEGDPGNHDCR